MLDNGKKTGFYALATLFLLMGTVAAVDDKAVKDELKKFEGEWIASGEGGEAHYTFKGDKLEVVGSTRTYKITVKLDPEAKPDKTLDMKIDEAPEDAKGKTSRAIYKFEDNDNLVICMRPEGERPTKFEQIGFEQILTKLKRKEP